MLTQDQWGAMKLPIRLYRLFMSKLGIQGKNTPVPMSDLQNNKEETILQQNLNFQKANEPNKLQMSEQPKHKSSTEESQIPLEENKKCSAKPIEVNLKNYISGLEDFDEILHQLNLKGESEGVAFKKGTLQYWKDKSVKYKSIICSCINRNSKHSKKDKGTRLSLEDGNQELS